MRTTNELLLKSQKCQKATSHRYSITSSVAGDKREWDRETERLGTRKNSADADAGQTMRICEVGSVNDPNRRPPKATSRGPAAELVD